MSQIEYRAASAHDLGEPVELWWLMQKSHDAYCPVFYNNAGPEESKTICIRYFADLLNQESCMTYVATSSGTLVGMIVAHFRTRPPVYEVRQQVELEIAVVLSSHRRRGIFRNLLALVEERAKLAGVGMLRLVRHLDWE